MIHKTNVWRINPRICRYWKSCSCVVFLFVFLDYFNHCSQAIANIRICIKGLTSTISKRENIIMLQITACTLCKLPKGEQCCAQLQHGKKKTLFHIYMFLHQNSFQLSVLFCLFGHYLSAACFPVHPQKPCQTQLWFVMQPRNAFVPAA